MANKRVHSVEEPEVWAFKKPKRADHIRVHRPDGFRGIPCTAYYHHGIYVSDSEVIHYTTPEGAEISKFKARVMQTNLAGFLVGGNLEVKVYNSTECLDLYPPDSVVSWARGCIDQGKYHLFFNNCEHFANCCTLGKHRSHQAERKLSFMGIGKWVGDTIKNIGSWLSGDNGGGDNTSRTTNTYTYEPDKVRIAEIERDTKLSLADKEKDMEEMRQDFEAAMIQAKFQGMGLVFEALQKTFAVAGALSEELYSTLEDSSGLAIKKIESFYSSMRVELRNDHFSKDHPLNALRHEVYKIPQDDPRFPVELARLEKEIALELDLYRENMTGVGKRLRTLVASSVRTKEKIIAQTNISKLLEKQMTLIHKNIEVALLTGKQAAPKQLPINQEKPTVALPKGKEINVTPGKNEPKKEDK